MADPKTKKDPAEEEDPKKQHPADPADDPPAADPAPATDPAEPKADPTGDPPAADPNEDPAPAADPAEPKDPETNPEDDPPATEPVTESPEVTALKMQLTEANARVAAYKSGVKSDAVEDAVVLAMHAVKTAGGEVSEEAIHQAIVSVLERHPEWNTATTPTAPVKVGAEPPAEPPKTKTAAALHGKVVL